MEYCLILFVRVVLCKCNTLTTTAPGTSFPPPHVTWSYIGFPKYAVQQLCATRQQEFLFRFPFFLILSPLPPPPPSLTPLRNVLSKPSSSQDTTCSPAPPSNVPSLNGKKGGGKRGGWLEEEKRERKAYQRSKKKNQKRNGEKNYEIRNPRPRGDHVILPRRYARGRGFGSEACCRHNITEGFVARPPRTDESIGPNSTTSPTRDVTAAFYCAYGVLPWIKNKRRLLFSLFLFSFSKCCFLIPAGPIDDYRRQKRTKGERRRKKGKKRGCLPFLVTPPGLLFFMIFPRSPLPAFPNINLRPFLSPSAALSTFSSFDYNTILIY